MKLTDDGKAEIVAAVLKSPLIMEIFRQFPIQKWDQPQEIATPIVGFAKAIIAEVEHKIP
jgi:hypothetical protein